MDVSIELHFYCVLLFFFTHSFMVEDADTFEQQLKAT